MHTGVGGRVVIINRRVGVARQAHHGALERFQARLVAYQHPQRGIRVRVRDGVFHLHFARGEADRAPHAVVGPRRDDGAARFARPCIHLPARLARGIRGGAGREAVEAGIRVGEIAGKLPAPATHGEGKATPREQLAAVGRRSGAWLPGVDHGSGRVGTGHGGALPRLRAHRELADDQIPLGAGIAQRARVGRVGDLQAVLRSRIGQIGHVQNERIGVSLVESQLARALEIRAVEDAPPAAAVPCRGEIGSNRRDERLVHQAERRPAFRRFHLFAVELHAEEEHGARERLGIEARLHLQENRRIRLRQSAKLEGACFARRNGGLFRDHRHLRGVRSPGDQGQEQACVLHQGSSTRLTIDET